MYDQFTKFYEKLKVNLEKITFKQLLKIHIREFIYGK